MSCEVKTFGQINLTKVQEYFGLNDDDNWMNAIHHSFSPTGEIISMANGKKLALLSSIWNIKNNTYSYSLCWCGELEDPDSIITSVFCLPIYGSNVSSGSEWTCVIVGLSSGMIVFYNDAGMKLFSQSFYDDPVLNIKVYTPKRRSEEDAQLFIIYDKCICVIKGIDLCPLLSTMRHNLNRITGKNQSSALESADLLSYQIYKFQKEKESFINDAVVSGKRPCSYDHIVEQCLVSGYFKKISTTPIQTSLVVGVGEEPFLGYYYAEEGYKTSSFSEVAKDVLGIAYKNFMGNLFGRTLKNSTPSSPEEPMSPSKETLMRTRCRIYDKSRHGLNITLSPGGHLAVVTDSLDRVMLIDTQSAVILRVWKGYRNARCAFVPVREKTLKGVETRKRRALFLIIYTARLGSLEIWALQNGPKVAAFNVSKNGQLIYNSHGLLGLPANSKLKAPIFYCLFIDSSDSTIKEIHIPFHYALSECNAQTSRDIHLLRRLKQLIRSEELSSTQLDEITKIASDFRTVEVRLQCLESLKNNKKLKPIVFNVITNGFVNSIDQIQSSDEKAQFENVVKNYKRLTDFYIEMHSSHSTGEIIEQLEFFDCDVVTIHQLLLLLGEKHAKKYRKDKDTDTKVQFLDQSNNNDGDFVDYLGIFQVDLPNKVPLSKSKLESYSSISVNLFGEFFDNALCLHEFQEHAKLSCIPPEDLLTLALHFWLEKPFEYRNCDEIIEDMSRLAAVVKTICELADDVNNYAYNSISPWWQKVREMLLESSKSLGVLVAIVCKNVASLLRNYREGSCDDTEVEEAERFEQITHDQAEWGLLIGKLEDIAVLGAILEYPLLSSDPVMPQLPYYSPDCSLKAIVSGGKGIVTDLTAQWIINSRIHPSKVLEHKSKSNKIQNTNSIEITANEDSVAEDIDNFITDDLVIRKLNVLREHFPFSLESGLLLCSMSWQYMTHWSKNLSSLTSMRAALSCLAQFDDRDLALKHGICVLLWNAVLKFPLQSTAKLIHKVGRLPVEKMCQQDIEISSALVPDFLEKMVEFLQHFRSSLNHEKRELKFEESLNDGPLPLQFLALQQHNAIEEILKIHYELCCALYFMTYFQLKHLKPLSTLFDALSNKAFFMDINKELSFVLPAPDLVLQQQREDFLCQVITASMDLIREDLEQLFVKEHLEYMENIIILANSWKLDKRGLFRRQIVDLYAHGYDSHAEKLLNDICDDEQIGYMLLEIAGRRLKLFSYNSQSAYLKIASVGQHLLQYLDNLDHLTGKSIQITSNESDQINIVVLITFLTQIFKFLPRDNPTTEVRIAAQMYDACCMLKDA